MARTLQFPTKRRTREHVIASQSANHVERFVIDAGHVALRVGDDYGYDLLVQTFDEDGYVEPGYVALQLKASESWQVIDKVIPFDLDVRDYNLWLEEPAVVILVLYDATKRKAHWLDVQQYFLDNPRRRPRARAKTVRVHVALRCVVNDRAVARFRDLKRDRV